MKKKLYILGLALVLSLSFTGCGKKDKNDDETSESKASDVKEDLLDFVNNELPPIEADRKAAVDVYNAYFANENINVDQYLSNLQNSAVPSMQSFVEKLGAIEVDTTEVGELKDLYLSYANKQLEAMKFVVQAISEQNPDYLENADACITESQLLLSQYNDKLIKLANENEIAIDSATATDAAPAVDTEATSEE